MQTSYQRGSAAIWAIFLVIIIGVIVAAVLYGQRNESSQTPAELTASQEEILQIQPDDNVLGDPAAPVVIIEYSDFQCPACATAYPVIKSALADFEPTEVAFVYRHLPLRQIHPNADIAARAAEAAGEQGEFFAMHDLLFDNQSIWSSERNPRDTFVEYATTLGLDIDQFANDINDEAIRTFVNDSYSEAEILLEGRLATPSIFLNGAQLNGAQLGNLTATIQAELDMIAEGDAMTDEAVTAESEEEVAATEAQ